MCRLKIASLWLFAQTVAVVAGAAVVVQIASVQMASVQMASVPIDAARIDAVMTL